MKQFYCYTQSDTTKIAFRVADGVPPASVAAAIQTEVADLPNVSMRTGQAFRNYELEDITRDFRLFDLILVLVSVLAGIGVLNALLLAAYERRKEIGVMKAIGMTRGQLARMVLIEAATTGIVGGTFGMLLGTAFVYLVIDALARLTGLPLRTVLQPFWLCVSVVGAIILSIAAAGFPIMRANRFSAASAVRYE